MADELKLASDPKQATAVPRRPAINDRGIAPEVREDANGNGKTGDKRRFVGVRLNQLVGDQERGTTLEYVAVNQAELNKMGEEILVVIRKYTVVTEAVQALRS